MSNYLAYDCDQKLFGKQIIKVSEAGYGIMNREWDILKAWCKTIVTPSHFGRSYNSFASNQQIIYAFLHKQ